MVRYSSFNLCGDGPRTWGYMALPKEEHLACLLIEFWVAHCVKILEKFLSESENEYFYGEKAKIELKSALRSLETLREKAK